MEEKEKIYYFNLSNKEKELAIANFEKIRSDIIYCLNIIFSDREKLEKDLRELNIKYIKEIFWAIDSNNYSATWTFEKKKISNYGYCRGLNSAWIKRNIDRLDLFYIDKIATVYNELYFSEKSGYDHLFNFNGRYLYLLLELEFSKYRDLIIAKIENIIIHEICHALLCLAPISHDSNFKKLGNYLAKKVGIKDQIISTYENSAVYLDLSSDYFVKENNKIYNSVEYSENYFEHIAAGYYENKIAIFGTDRAIELRNYLLELELEDLNSGGKINYNSHSGL